MKLKYKIGIGIFIVTLCVSTNVYAGSLNSNEQALLNYARGTFEYNGKYYKATESALATARAMLLRDDIDLTDEQLEKAYVAINQNIKTGIYNGYLVEVTNKSEETTEDIECSIKIEEQQPSEKPSETLTIETPSQSEKKEELEQQDSYIEDGAASTKPSSDLEEAFLDEITGSEQIEQSIQENKTEVPEVLPKTMTKEEKKSKVPLLIAAMLAVVMLAAILIRQITRKKTKEN